MVNSPPPRNLSGLPFHIGAAAQAIVNTLFGPDAARNQQMNLAYGLTRQGIHPQDAAALSQTLAYHPYNTSPLVQQAFLNQLKGMGYLPHQAF